MNHFWYFKTTVEIDGKEYNYRLNIGRNRFDGNISLYDLNNYNEKDVNPFRVSSTGDITSSNQTIPEETNSVKDKIKSSKELNSEYSNEFISLEEQREFDTIPQGTPSTKAVISI